MKKLVSLGLIFLLLLTLVSCGSAPVEETSDQSSISVQLNNEESSEEEPTVVIGAEREHDPNEHYAIPEMAEAAFQGEAAEEVVENVWIDDSHISDGYIGVSAKNDHQLKMMILKGDEKYVYDIDPNGEASVLPFQLGDGEYTCRVMENVEGNKYGELYSGTYTVSIQDKYKPFLISTDYIRFTKDSLCVKKAEEIAGNSADVLVFVNGVYSFVTENFVYDNAKAQSTLEIPYIPDLDETFNAKSGICVDFAATVAAMLRSQGVPCKVIYGYVGDIYHAWNMFYTEETGWITVSYEVNGKNWSRLDATFKSSGAEDEFVIDNNNYIDVYTY